MGKKIYNAMKAFGFCVLEYAGDGSIFARPLTGSEVAIPAGSYAFSVVQATSTGVKDSYINTSGLCYIVNSSGVITEEV